MYYGAGHVGFALRPRKTTVTPCGLDRAGAAEQIVGSIRCACSGGSMKNSVVTARRRSCVHNATPNISSSFQSLVRFVFSSMLYYKGLIGVL